MPFNRTASVLRERHRESTISFDPSSGRLRYFRNERIVVELLPPHSWTFVASVATNSHWGTRPSQDDLAIVLHAFRSNYPNIRQPGAGAAWLARAHFRVRAYLAAIRRLRTRQRVAT